ncbi:MAG: hypothetical protein Q4F63_02420 [Clostridia bacterium]|nr:hypothetical protein [Clostridia bacterium]
MRVYKKKTCPNFKPLPQIPYMFRDEPKCSHCAFYSDKSCYKGFLDTLDYDDDRQ